MHVCQVYGGGWKAVVNLLYVTETEAKGFLRDLSTSFPEIDSYSKYLMGVASKQGFIINPYGRKTTIDSEYVYKCVNYMVQGTAADMMKTSVHECRKWLMERNLRGYPLLPVHDELIVEFHKDHAYHWAIEGVRAIMEDHEDKVGVPMPVAIKRCSTYWSVEEKYEGVLVA